MRTWGMANEQESCSLPVGSQVGSPFWDVAAGWAQPDYLIQMHVRSNQKNTEGLQQLPPWNRYGWFVLGMVWWVHTDECPECPTVSKLMAAVLSSFRKLLRVHHVSPTGGDGHVHWTGQPGCVRFQSPLRHRGSSRQSGLVWKFPPKR